LLVNKEIIPQQISQQFSEKNRCQTQALHKKKVSLRKMGKLHDGKSKVDFLAYMTLATYARQMF
jgi:hypothetical protein